MVGALQSGRTRKGVGLWGGDNGRLGGFHFGIVGHH